LPRLSIFLLFAVLLLVGDSGFEPLTSSASRKRSPPELIAPAHKHPSSQVPSERRHPESNRGTGFCRPLPNHSAMPPTRRHLRPRGKSGRRDSNPRPSPWQGDALPTELLPPARADNLARPLTSYKRPPSRFVPQRRRRSGRGPPTSAAPLSQLTSENFDQSQCTPGSESPCQN
jgi:hypothetical protein